MPCGRHLSSSAVNAPLPISCLPNAGMPENINGKAVYSLSPSDFSDSLVDFTAKFKLAVVGGCCGTRPEHLKMLVDKLQGFEKGTSAIQVIPRMASAFNPLDMRQEPRATDHRRTAEHPGQPQVQTDHY